MNFEIVVKSMPNGNKYFVNGVQQPTLELIRGMKYVFSQVDSSNNNHPLRISATDNGTHGGGVQYTDGWAYRGTAGSNGNGIFVVPDNSPNELYYYCQHHSGMGGAIRVLDEAPVSVESDSKRGKFVKQAGLVGATLYLAYKLRNRE